MEEEWKLSTQLSRGMHPGNTVGFFFSCDMNSNETVTLGVGQDTVRSTASPSLARHCPLIYSAKVISRLRRGRQHTLALGPRATICITNRSRAARKSQAALDRTLPVVFRIMFRLIAPLPFTASARTGLCRNQFPFETQSGCADKKKRGGCDVRCIIT